MKRNARSHQGLRLFSRLAVATISLIVFALVGVQFAHIIDRNVAMATSLHDIQVDVDTLRERKREQERELTRLSDPVGSIPEIHDRLHLVGPHETIIYLKAPKKSEP
ncbi:MAG: hypothetical protein M3N19_00935 [Candidatus Eremiobacteraeota bacterium]|nr:hypothetical protein [Candidatus Eremiobacteraeota bacterium]